MFSVPLELPTDPADVFIIPAIAVFFGLLAYLMGEFNTHLKGRLGWKIVGAGILIFGSLTGFRYFLAMVSGSPEGEMYRSLLFQRRMIYVHYLAFWLPLVIFLLLLAVSFVRGRRQNLMYDEF